VLLGQSTLEICEQKCGRNTEIGGLLQPASKWLHKLPES